MKKQYVLKNMFNGTYVAAVDYSIDTPKSVPFTEVGEIGKAMIFNHKHEYVSFVKRNESCGRLSAIQLQVIKLLKTY